jgi:putative tricarboxylic transport membrane protein
MTPKTARAGILIGLAVFLFGIVVAWQVTRIPLQPAYARVGPTLFPWLLAAMFLSVGAAIMLQSRLGAWEGAPAPGSLHRRSLAWVAAGLLINLFAIEHVGFILASTALFLCTARAFGSTHPWRDGAIGFALAFIAYVGFDRVLDYQIGAGLIEDLL